MTEYEIIHTNGDVIVSREIISEVAQEEGLSPKEVAERGANEVDSPNIIAVAVE